MSNILLIRINCNTNLNIYLIVLIESSRATSHNIIHLSQRVIIV